MAVIITGGAGQLAYWDAAPPSQTPRAFGVTGDFHKSHLCSFAGLSAFADNSNHPPAEFDGAVTWDAGIDLLFRIADAR